MLRFVPASRRPKVFQWMDRFDRVKAFAFKRNHGQSQAGVNLSDFYERIWREAAQELGAIARPLGCGVIEITRGKSRTLVQHNSTAMDHLATHCIVRTKPVIYRMLAAEGLPVPRNLEFGLDELTLAEQFLSRIGAFCVVKPGSDTGGGLGVTTGVQDPWHLGRAAWMAARHSQRLLIEEQIEGDNYRLLYLDGKLIDAVVRKPPTLISDGKSRLEDQVKKLNQERLKGKYGVSHGLLTLDMDMERTLARQGLTFDSIPKAGTKVTLKTAINENSGPDNVTATHLLGPALIREGAKAAKIAGVRLAGVDIITSDPSLSLKKAGGVILEVNSPPGYYWHYQKHDGPFPVAVHVLKELL